MKEIINLILETKNITVEREITKDSYQLLFTNFDGPIEDYFSIIFIKADELLRIEQIDPPELIAPENIINDVLLSFRKDETNNIYDLKNNLSSIILVDCSEKDYPINKVKKIEDDKFYAKKYVLKYNTSDIEKLKKELKIVKTESNDFGYAFSLILNKHDFLSEEHVQDLTKPVNSWYRLLLDFYIKIPFLNYIVPEQKNLLDLDSQINQKLGSNSLLFEKILAFELTESDEEFEQKITSIISQ